MCMITYLPAGVAVPEREISNGSHWNDDGHGWAVAADIGNMITGHYMDRELALITFKAAREAFPDSPAMFHSRWATHGTVDTSNVHPFPVGRHAVMAHNGVLPSSVTTSLPDGSTRFYRFQPVGKDKRSDTRILAEDYMMQRLSPRGMFSRRERRWMGKLIGSHNKLCILTVSPKFERPRGLLVNANSGNWWRGAWFSNYDYDNDWAQYRHSTKRYSWLGSTGYGMGKGEDDETPLGATSAPSGDGMGKSLALRNDNECRWCLGLGGINSWGVCEYCQTCQDCAQSFDNCVCWVPVKEREGNDNTFTVAGFCTNCNSWESECECDSPDLIRVGPYQVGEE